MSLFLNDDNYSRNLNHSWDLLSFLDGGQRIDNSRHMLPIRSTAICNGIYLLEGFEREEGSQAESYKVDL